MATWLSLPIIVTCISQGVLRLQVRWGLRAAVVGGVRRRALLHVRFAYYVRAAFSPTWKFRSDSGKDPTYSLPRPLHRPNRQAPAVGKSSLCIMSCRQLVKTSAHHTILLLYCQ